MEIKENANTNINLTSRRQISDNFSSNTTSTNSFTIDFIIDAISYLSNNENFFINNNWGFNHNIYSRIISETIVVDNDKLDE